VKKIAAICIILAVGMMSSDVFAQRYVNSADQAAKAARTSMEKRGSQSSSQIGWLNDVINVINMDQQPVNVNRDVAAENNKAIEESKYR